MERGSARASDRRGNTEDFLADSRTPSSLGGSTGLRTEMNWR